MSLAARSRPALGALVVLAAWIVAVGAQLLANRYTTGQFGTPVLVFGFVVFVTSICLVLALALLFRGFRRGTAETALLGSFLVAVSVLPLTHGLLVPDVLYGPNDATRRCY